MVKLPVITCKNTILNIIFALSEHPKQMYNMKNG